MSSFDALRGYREHEEAIVITGDGPPPGRRTLTMNLRPRAAGGPAVARDPAVGAAERAQAADAGIDRLLDAAMRPDLYADQALPANRPEDVFEAATEDGACELPFRAEMERRFAVDFGNVRAFVGRARELAALDAVAATRGEDIVFAPAAPDQRAVARELTHVVQARARGGAPRLTITARREV